MIRAVEMNLSFGNEAIYDKASFLINTLDKVGIVGVNGAGKTTLFKLILNQLELDGGSLTINEHHIGYLPQEIVFEDENLSVWDYIYEARPIKQLQEALIKAYEQLTANPNEHTKWEKEIERINDELYFYRQYDAEDDLLDLIKQFDISDDLLYRNIKELSGGQKSKIAFARMLFSKPEILLLDEPTNHLDASAKTFITNYLKEYHGTILIISHDIDFLNQIVGKIIFINKVTHKISTYVGDYTNFKRKYAQEMALKEMRIRQQEREIKKLQDFVKRADEASRTAHKLKAMGQSKQKLLDKKLANLEKRDKVYNHVKMNIEPSSISERTPLKVQDLCFRYPDGKYLYQNLNFELQRGERFLIVGENGIGKSTLLKLLVGKLAPTNGVIKWSDKSTIAYYAQELELLDSSKTVFANVDHNNYIQKEIRAYLANFLFQGDAVFKKVEVLSPGEKARLSLLKILLDKTNTIILDEPTNHFDPDTQEIIGENFKDFKGTLIVVSHNPKFVQQIGITRMLVLPECKIVEYSEELLDYYYYLNTDLMEQ